VLESDGTIILEFGGGSPSFFDAALEKKITSGGQALDDRRG